MISLRKEVRSPLEDEIMKEMFEARKRVFVDLLGWDVPVLEDRFEIDQYDDEHATYLILAGEGGHMASARLLQTVRPHILDTLFPGLCAAAPPRGPRILEITRFCLDRRLAAADRLAARNRLVSALVDHALERGIDTYTGVAELGWLQQILAFGWSCRPLGLPRIHEGRMLGALRIDVSPETPDLLAANGIYSGSGMQGPDAAQPAAEEGALEAA